MPLTLRELGMRLSNLLNMTEPSLMLVKDP